MEGVKFARMVHLDTAAFYGAEAQEEGVIGGSHISNQISAINARQTAVLSAKMHSVQLDALQKKSNLLRVTIRGLNRFLTEVMEGEKRPKQEAFADFLINLAASYSALPECGEGTSICSEDLFCGGGGAATADTRFSSEKNRRGKVAGRWGVADTGEICRCWWCGRGS
jgi:hypothetical protein